MGIRRMICLLFVLILVASQKAERPAPAAVQPFVEGAGPRPLGAQLYPADMINEEFEAWDQAGKDGPH